MTNIEIDTMHVIQSACRKIAGDKKIDWEQRRYEIAKDVMCALLSQPDDGRVWENLEAYCVSCADDLINELKK